MDRLQYNILLEESGIYGKRKLDKDEEYDLESNYVYQETSTKDKYEIIPNDLSTEEIQIVLLTKQLKMLDSLHTQFAVLILIILIPIILCLIFMIS